MSEPPSRQEQHMDYEDFQEITAMETEHYDDDMKITTRFQSEHEEKLDSCWNRFCKALRGCWATKHSEDTEHDRELYIKTTIRELLVYLIFLLILMIIAFGMTSGVAYYYTNILTGLFAQANFADNSTNYVGSTSMNDYWKFLTGPVMGGLYWNLWYNTAPMDQSQINFINYESKLIGVPRLRQIRVSNTSCKVSSEFQSNIQTCYALYSASTESKESFGFANSTAWTYSNESALNGRSSPGTIATYGGGGFYVDLNQTLSDSMQTITFLFNNRWIDRGTRAVILDFTVYNANINLFCVIKFVTEFPGIGGLIPNSEFRTVKLIRYVTVTDYCILACEIVLIVFILYYSIEEILEIKRHKWLYFTSLWNWMDLVVLFISITCIGFNFYRTVVVQSFLTDLLVNQNMYSNFDFISYWQLQFNNAVAFTLFMAWIKIFKYVSFNKTMSQLSVTLSSCAKDMVGFAVMFFIVFLAFAQLGYLIFASQVADFCKFEITIYTLFRIILADMNFSALQNANSLLGPLYFILYVFFAFFILFNMFIAIISETFKEVKEELAQKANEFEMADYFKQRANLVLNKLNIKRARIIDIQSAINSADANNDNRLDFDEWRAELKSRGYADHEIEAAFARYDSDGDRVLDEEERKKMQIELENQKISLTDKIDKNMNNDDNESEQSESKPSITIEEYHVLNLRVDRMETTVSSIVTKFDSVLQNLINMEKTKSKDRDAVGQILSTLTMDDNLSEEERQKRLEQLVNQEISKMNQDSLISLRPKSGGLRGSNVFGRN